MKDSMNSDMGRTEIGGRRLDALVLRLVVGLGLALYIGTGGAATAQALHPMVQVASVMVHKPAPSKAVGPAADDVGPETVQSPSGLTVVQVTPAVVRTAEQVTIGVRSLRAARVVITVAYPDGQTETFSGRAAARSGMMGLYVQTFRARYDPLDSSAVVNVSVAVSKGIAFTETVQTTFTVVRRTLLAGAYLRVQPARLRAGQDVVVTVHTPLPYVQVHVTVVDPSQQSTAVDGTTNANGGFVTRIPISYNPQGHPNAELLVTALLSYESQTRLLQQRVLFLPSS